MNPRTEMITNNEKAREIVRANRYLSLATHANSETWIAALSYVFNERFHFYWYSEKSAKHSQHIQLNRMAAAAIFNSQASSDEVDGLQMSGEVREIENSELLEVSELYYRQSFPDLQTRERWRKPLENFRGTGLQRFYEFRPTKIFKCDLENTSVDRRIEVNFLAD